MITFYLASNNAHKATEIGLILKDLRLNIEVRSAKEIGGMPEVEENADSFEGNALIKLNALIPKLPEGCYAIADDSGICVDALGGAPGIYSARFAGPQCDDDANNQKMFDELRNVPAEQKTARYVCCIAWGNEKGQFTVEDTCEGLILDKLYGDGGFGYDPLFQPLGYSCSMGLISAEEKNTISHRFKALKKFAEQFKS
jgi:XTP/dITP diphosphohydrolase